MEPEQLEKLKADLLLDEGFRRFVYKDSLGVETVGIGRNLRDKGIILSEARGLLQNDIKEIWQNFILLLPWIVNLNATRQNVLSNIAFNVGVGGLLKFKNMLEAARLGKFDLAAKELLDSQAARVSPNRYCRLSRELQTGRPKA